MTTNSIKSAAAKPDATSVLATLAAAMGDGPAPTETRVCAVDARSPEEGLALLGAYVAIADTAVRQAILDAVVMITTRA